MLPDPREVRRAYVGWPDLCRHVAELDRQMHAAPFEAMDAPYRARLVRVSQAVAHLAQTMIIREGHGGQEWWNSPIRRTWS